MSVHDSTILSYFEQSHGYLILLEKSCNNSLFPPQFSSTHSTSLDFVHTVVGRLWFRIDSNCADDRLIGKEQKHASCEECASVHAYYYLLLLFVWIVKWNTYTPLTYLQLAKIVGTSGELELHVHVETMPQRNLKSLELP